MENLNNNNLNDQFLMMYIKHATLEQLGYIKMLLKQGDYKSINTIVEEYAKKIIYNKEIKTIDGSGSSNGGNSKRFETKKEFSTEDMDPQAFELYCILELIEEYEREQSQDKKILLDTLIRLAIESYRNPKIERVERL